MSEIPVLNIEGKKVGSVKVDEALFTPRVDQQAVKDVAVAWRANQRRGTANTKTKSEINFSGAKPWRQKGTGRARCGERSSPIWRKGAVAFGPRPHSFHKSLNKKVKHAALQVVLADKLAQNHVLLVDAIALEQPKTKLLVGLLEAWKVQPSAMIVLEKADRNVELAARNIPGVEIQDANTVTTYGILQHKQLVTTPGGFDRLKARGAAEAASGGKSQ